MTEPLRKESKVRKGGSVTIEDPKAEKPKGKPAEAPAAPAK